MVDDVLEHLVCVVIHHWFSSGHPEVFQILVECWPPFPERSHIRIFLPVGYWPSTALEVFRSIMRRCGWKLPVTLRLFTPGSGELWRTVTTLEITSVVEVYLHVPRGPTCGHWILFDCFKVLHGPWLTGSVVSVRHLTGVFHLPAVRTSFRAFAL